MKLKNEVRDKQISLIGLMYDLRGNFPSSIYDFRIKLVIKLAESLGLKVLAQETKKIFEETNGDFDGRFFRDCKDNYYELSKRFKISQHEIEKWLEI